MGKGRHQPGTIDLCGARTPREKLLRREKERLANMRGWERKRGRGRKARRRDEVEAGEEKNGVG